MSRNNADRKAPSRTMSLFNISPFIAFVIGVVLFGCMFFIGTIALLVSIICFVYALFVGLVNLNNGRGKFLFAASVIFLIAIITVTIGSLVSVSAGNVAVITNSPDSDLIGSTLGEGWHFNPVYALSNIEIIRYNTQTAEFVGDDYTADDDTGSIQVLSKDNLAIVLDFSITYNLPRDNVSEIRMTYGPDFADTIIKQVARSVPRDVCANYNATDIIGDDRTLVEQTIKANVIKEIEHYGVDVVEVKLREIRPPTSLMTAIEDKKVAEQAVITAEYNKQRITIEAEAEMTRVLISADAEAQAAILRANGSAQAIYTVMAMLQGENENSTVANYLAWLYIQALMDPNSNVSYILDNENILLTISH